MNCKSSYGLYLEWYFKTYMGVKVTQSCPTLCDPMGYTVHGILQARLLEWVAFPFSGDLPNPGLPHCRQILYQLSHRGSPRRLEWVAYSFSRGSSQPRSWTGVPLHCRWILYQLSYRGSLSKLTLGILILWNLAATFSSILRASQWRYDLMPKVYFWILHHIVWHHLTDMSLSKLREMAKNREA